MSLLEFLKPLTQNKLLLGILFIVFTGLAWIGIQQLPETQKTTIYFTIKPLKVTESEQLNLDPIESSTKVAEMIAGWAKNPAFRDQILDNAGVYVSNFKRKITAQKQNRTNVFWTIKLSGEEKKHADKIVGATLKTFEANFNDFNNQNSFPFGFTEPSTSSQTQTIPMLWKIIAALFIGKILAFMTLYGMASLRGRITFQNQIQRIFPESPILKITQKIGKHDAKLLEQFILTFDAPRLIGTFPKAEKHFSLVATENIDLVEDTPVLLVKMGTTKVSELENMQAIFGGNVGIITFEK